MPDNNNKEPTLGFEDLFLVSSGIREDNLYASACSMNLTRQLSEDDAIPVKTVYINAPIVFYCSGGAVTATIDFAPKDTANFRQLVSMCTEWLKTKEDTLTLTVVPMITGGCLFMILTDLIFLDFYVRDDKKRRVILTFNNEVTSVVANEDIDIEEIQRQVDYELKKEEEDLDNQIVALEKEEQELEEQIAAEKYLYNYNELVYEEDEEEDEESGLRVVKTEDNIRGAEEDYDS